VFWSVTIRNNDKGIAKVKDRFLPEAEPPDGGFVKLSITAYVDGTYTLDWAYAGAGRADF